MHASCSAISGVRYSQFTLLVAFYRARDYSCFGIYRHSFAVQGHSTASLVIFLSIMGETGNDLPPLESNPRRSSQESAFSGEETLNLVSRLLDTKLDKKFSEFKRGLEQKDLATDSQIKKLKTEAKAASNFHFKGNKLQFEFNSSLLDSIDSASASLLDGDLSRVNQELENAKTLLRKRNKAIRFADKSPAGWTAVEEYESDELADDSEDEKKLRSAESRALSKLRVRKQNQHSSNPLQIFSRVILCCWELSFCWSAFSSSAIPSAVLSRSSAISEQTTTAFR